MQINVMDNKIPNVNQVQDIKLENDDDVLHSNFSNGRHCKSAYLHEKSRQPIKFNAKKEIKCENNCFNIVDKWIAKVVVQVPTGNNWNNIIAREIALLKVRYPFLPERQLRGKALVKFGIPSSMGDIMRTGATKLTGLIARELSKNRVKNPRIPLAFKVRNIYSCVKKLQACTSTNTVTQDKQTFLTSHNRENENATFTTTLNHYQSKDIEQSQLTSTDIVKNPHYHLPTSHTTNMMFKFEDMDCRQPTPKKKSSNLPTQRSLLAEFSRNIELVNNSSSKSPRNSKRHRCIAVGEKILGTPSKKKIKLTSKLKYQLETTSYDELDPKNILSSNRGAQISSITFSNKNQPASDKISNENTESVPRIKLKYKSAASDYYGLILSDDESELSYSDRQNDAGVDVVTDKNIEVDEISQDFNVKQDTSIKLSQHNATYDKNLSYSGEKSPFIDESKHLVDCSQANISNIEFTAYGAHVDSMQLLEKSMSHTLSLKSCPTSPMTIDTAITPAFVNTHIANNCQSGTSTYFSVPSLPETPTNPCEQVRTLDSDQQVTYTPKTLTLGSGMSSDFADVSTVKEYIPTPYLVKRTLTSISPGASQRTNIDGLSNLDMDPNLSGNNYTQEEPLLSNFCCEYDQGWKRLPNITRDIVNINSIETDSAAMTMKCLKETVTNIIQFLDTDIEDD